MTGSWCRMSAYPCSDNLACRRYADGLADAVVKAGGQIYEQSRVRAPSTHTCTTLDGHNVRSSLLVAVKAPAPHEMEASICDTHASRFCVTQNGIEYMVTVLVGRSRRRRLSSLLLGHPLRMAWWTRVCGHWLCMASTTQSAGKPS